MKSGQRAELAPDEAAEAARRFALPSGDPQGPCTHCGGLHGRACPRVRSLEWSPGGSLTRVEFWRDGQWDSTTVIFPDDLPAEPADDVT